MDFVWRVAFILAALFLSREVSALRELVRWEPVHLLEQSLFADESIKVVPMCTQEDSINAMIYCGGQILEAYNALKITDDSKTFVDRPMNNDPDSILLRFNALFKEVEAYEDMNRNLFINFLNQYFDPAGAELEHCTPLDWRAHPKKIMQIKDPVYVVWALELHAIWRRLCRVVKYEVNNAPERHSLIVVDNEFIAPGGRFREFYYWDSYWIIRGLVVSDMQKSILNELKNFFQMVRRFGFVPNGGRNYYLGRSQPPFLIPMAYEYTRGKKSRSLSVIKDVLELLETELHFWENNRGIDVKSPKTNKTHYVYQYHTATNVPRPESFKEDLSMAESIETDAEKARFFMNIASATESGWDFSSRWFADPGVLHSIETINIVPVDLNAVICWNYNILAYLFFKWGDYNKAEIYQRKVLEMQEAMSDLFYNETLGSWFDFNLRRNAQNTEIFYLSSAVPLFTKCYDDLNRAIPERFMDYLDSIGVLEFPGGVPTSMYQKVDKMNNVVEGEQWDFPNGWSPLNHMLIEGLRKSDTQRGRDLAFALADKWLNTNFISYAKDCAMWEKYDINGTARAGTGGEYDVQEGFGWTNGVVLDLLYTYRDRNFTRDPIPPRGANKECLEDL